MNDVPAADDFGISAAVRRARAPVLTELGPKDRKVLDRVSVSMWVMAVVLALVAVAGYAIYNEATYQGHRLDESQGIVYGDRAVTCDSILLSHPDIAIPQLPSPCLDPHVRPLLTANAGGK